MATATAVSDDLSHAYLFLFLALGQAALFGGLCVTYSNIPAVFYGAYHTAVPALTCVALKRALTGLALMLPGYASIAARRGRSMSVCVGHRS